MENRIYSSSAVAQGAAAEAEKTTQTKKVTMTSIDFNAIAKARKGFNMTLSQFKSNDMKLAYLRNAASSFDDGQKFYNRYMVMVNELKNELADRISVKEACESKGVDLEVLATHVVFLGKTAVAQVKKYGVGEKSPVYGQLDLFKDRFLPDNAQDFIDASWKPSDHLN